MVGGVAGDCLSIYRSMSAAFDGEKEEAVVFRLRPSPDIDADRMSIASDRVLGEELLGMGSGGIDIFLVDDEESIAVAAGGGGGKAGKRRSINSSMA